MRGEVARDTATAAFMGLNVLARYIEIERKLKETDELEARLEALEENMQRNQQGGRRWG